MIDVCYKLRRFKIWRIKINIEINTILRLAVECIYKK